VGRTTYDLALKPWGQGPVDGRIRPQGFAADPVGALTTTLNALVEGIDASC